MRARSSLIVALAGLFCACQAKDPVAAWIDDDTAYLRCARVGQAPKGAKARPQAPQLPTPRGFYVGEMQEASLHMAGFAKESVVCASLQAPSSASMLEAKTQLMRLTRARKAMQKLVLQSPCACETLYKQGLRGLEPSCLERGLSSQCQAPPAKTQALLASIQTLNDQIEQTPVLPTHWRMVGKAGAKNGWVRNHPRLLSALPGASEVFLRRKTVVAGKNRALVEALLKVPGVVAVVRQRKGQALLVVRYLRDEVLVLDYFEYPKSAMPHLALLHKLDNANVEFYRRALAAPEHPRVWSVKGKTNVGWGWSLPALLRVDSAQALWSHLGDRPYDEHHEIWRHPAALAQAGWMRPYQKETYWGWELVLQDPLKLEVSERKPGLDQWAWPRFVPAPGQRDFPLRASAWGQGWIYAISSLPQRARLAAGQRVGSWEGKEGGFVYRWEAQELPLRNLGSPEAQRFYARLRELPGQWSWSAGPRPATVTLDLQLGKKSSK